MVTTAFAAVTGRYTVIPKMQSKPLGATANASRFTAECGNREKIFAS